MAETAPRHTRSNSLQRMLNLEKQYLNERLRIGSNQLSYPSVKSSSIPLPSESFRPTTARGRQIEPQTVQDRRRSEQRHRSFALQTQPPKPRLVIDVSTASPKPSSPVISQPVSNMRIRRGNKSVPAIPPSIPYSSTVEASPTPESGNDSSVCQSPSWEAYDKRKQEKKEERRVKDEAKATKKPRRLSKAPPASPPNASNSASPYQSQSATMDISRKPRSASMVFSDNTSKDPLFYKQPRSRAGSFSSLIKSTFDFRRSSIDQSQERPFIGGIKLEYEKHIASERNMDPSAIEPTDVHPALRASSTALKSQPPPSRAPGTKNTTSRTYPPNTFQTTKSKSMFLASPISRPVPDLSTIEKWRARVRLRSSSKSSSSRNPITTEASPVSETSETPTQRNVSSGNQDAKKHEQDGEQAMEKPAILSQELVRKTPPPPEPPRRSSKRNSTLIGSPSLPLLNLTPLNVPIGTAISPLYDLPSTAVNGDTNQPSASPSWENIQSSVMDTIEHTIKPMAEAEKKHEKEQGEKAFWNSQEWVLQRSEHPHMTSSSSEDSASDCFNTVSMPSTPNTSRPQSEKGLPRISGESERFTLPRIQLHDNAYPSEACSFVSASSFTGAHDIDREVDPIQAAARKVMAALPPMPSAKPATEHEPLNLPSNFTDFSSISDISFVDVPKLSLKNTKSQPTKRTNGDTVAKVFVECCGCKYYHDMPSRLYDAMVNPDVVLCPKDRSDFGGAISMTVTCPWCKHAMSTSCCAGLAAMVYVKERLH